MTKWTSRWKVAHRIRVDLWIEKANGDWESHETILLDPGTILNGPVDISDKSTMFRLDDGREIGISHRHYEAEVLEKA